ncbi:Cytochrome b-c1 complex subunit 2 mitochondrial, partial [Fasciola gigantica]
KSRFCRFILSSRNAVTAAASKPSVLCSPVITTSEEGFQLASIAQPNLWTGLTRVAIVFNAGSRYELSCKDRGITHLIRRAFGLSTPKFTAVNLTRHFQQMGARVMCTTTREHMIYTVDVAPNFASRAGYLLAEMATGQAFYSWELKSTANKLMKKDIELFNRRNLEALSMELLHEAAFGTNPDGSGLGNSVIAPMDRVGTYSIDQIEQFHQHSFTPAKCTVVLVGNNSTSEAGIEQLREIKTGLRVRPPHVPSRSSLKPHGFVGGEIRRDLAAASEAYAQIAWPTSGEGPNKLALDVGACLLTGAIDRISFGGNASRDRLNTGLHENDPTHTVAFHKTYADHGLFGLSLRGPCALLINDRLTQTIRMMRTLKVTSEQLKNAKSICKANILMELESPANLAIDLAVQVSKQNHTYESPEVRAAKVDAIDANAVNTALQQVLSSPLAALSVVGLDAGFVLPLPVLLSA